MTLRQLELFLAIAETGSFSRGGATVALTQSTASQHVAALEAQLGARLFDRSGKGVKLTPAGELFLQHSRRILAERDALIQAMAGYRGLEAARLTIGASNIPATYLVPLLLPQLKQTHPGITVTMLSGDTREVLKSLVAAEVELALIGHMPTLKGVDVHPLVEDPLVLVVGPGHRWGASRQIALTELLAEPLIVRESGSGSGRSLEEALRKAGHDPGALTIGARLGSNEAVLQAVMAGFGCAFVSAISVRPILQSGALTQVTVAGLNVTRQIWLASLQNKTLSPAAQVFADLLRQTYSGG